jgi:UDP-N-acetylmuramoylalanine--D-glutamate ligase
MAEFSVAGRRVVVVGAARSGVAAAELLVSRGACVTLTELKSRIDSADRLRAAGVGLELGGHRAETLSGADLIVLSPGVPSDQPVIAAARAEGVPVIAEIELVARWLRGPIVAVTGTKGKSTTTTLAGRMLEAAGFRVLVGGNIGVPLSSQVERSTPDTFHVIEVSSFQLEGIDQFHPWIAVLLNFSPDHLDRHPTVEAYANAKARVVLNQTAEDWAVVNADDPYVLELARRGRARLVRFALESAIDEGLVIEDDAVAHRSGARITPLVPVRAIRLIGRHLRNDVLAAAAVGWIAGVPPEAMTRAVEGFTGLEHAMEPAGEIGGVRFVNDSKATNIAAARLALESIERGLVPILGGRFKGGDFRDLRAALAARERGIVAIGEARPLVRDALGDLVPIRAAGSMADAVRMAYEMAAPDGTVVLAPACASFDMFADYAERGRAFKREVERLQAARGKGEQ